MPQQVYRQGDVVLVVVDGVPIMDNLVKSESTLIRKGEHGGKHSIETLEQASIYELFGKDVKVGTPPTARYLLATQDANIVHSEHKTITVPKGFYLIGTQREDFHGIERRVAD